MLAVLSVTGFMSGAFGQIGRATPLLFFEKKSKQKKLRLFVLREIFISSEKRFFSSLLYRKGFEKKSKQKKLRLSGSFKAPLCKGSSAAGGEGLFFYIPYTGEAKETSVICLRGIFISSEKRFFHLCFIAKALKIDCGLM